MVRLLRIAAQGESSALPAGLQARLGYAASERCVPSAPLDAYPLPVLAAMKEAALADVRSITARLDAGRALASAGQDPQTAGWLDRQNVLWRIREHGPLTAGRMRELGWHGNRHGGARDLNNDLFLGVNDLVPFLVALLCLTGLEPECAKGLRGDCLSSPSGGFWTLAYDKPRAHTGTGKTMRVRGGGTATPAWVFIWWVSSKNARSPSSPAPTHNAVLPAASRAGWVRRTASWISPGGGEGGDGQDGLAGQLRAAGGGARERVVVAGVTAGAGGGCSAPGKVVPVALDDHHLGGAGQFHRDCPGDLAGDPDGADLVRPCPVSLAPCRTGSFSQGCASAAA